MLSRAFSKAALLCASAVWLLAGAGAVHATEPTPVTTIDQQVIETASSLPEALRLVPQTLEETNEFQSNGMDGSSTFSLHDLGGSRTLTLINGRRFGALPAANLNLVPVEALERIDVYGAGGGAYFGPNAVGGAVNLVLKAPDHGLEFIAKGGFAAHDNDNGESRAALTDAGQPAPHGFHTDAGVWSLTALGGDRWLGGALRASFYLNYRRVEPVYASQRDYQACPFAPSDTTDAHVCTGSDVGSPGWILPLIGDFAFGQFSPTASRDYVDYDGSLYNYAPPNNIRIASSRTTAGGSADYRLSPRATLYAETELALDDTRHQVAPDGIFPEGAWAINCDNPLMSAAQAVVLGCNYLGPTDDTIAVIARRNAEGDPRAFAERHTLARFVAGMRGDLSPAWSYDLSALYTRTDVDTTSSGFFALSRIQEALEVVSVGGVPTCKSVVDHSDPACVPYDIFSPSGSTAAARKFLEASQTNHDLNEEWMLSADLRGDLTSMGIKSPFAGHGLSIDLGADYRRLRERFLPGHFDAIGDITGEVISPFEGASEVSSVKLDLTLPLVEDRAGFRRLALGGTYRASDDSRAGSYWMGKAQLTWSPIDGLALWGGTERSAREPSSVDRFSGQGQFFPFVIDPCAGALSVAQANLCAARFPGTNPALFGSIPNCFFCAAILGGNAALKPEFADITTFGLDVSPSGLKGFEVRLEAFDIQSRGMITAPDARGVVSGCIDFAITSDCALIHRDPVTGSMGDGQGFLDLTLQNLMTMRIRGVDVGATYARPLRLFGRNGALGLVFRGAYLDRWDFTPMAGEGVLHCAGVFGVCGDPAPRWRHNLTARWTPEGNPWNVEARWRHVGSMAIDPNFNCFCHDTADLSARDYDVFDLSGSLNLTRRVRLGVSIDNVFDRVPPLLSPAPFAGAFASNTFPTLYDSLGRTVLFTLDARY